MEKEKEKTRRGGGRSFVATIVPWRRFNQAQPLHAIAGSIVAIAHLFEGQVSDRIRVRIRTMSPFFVFFVLVSFRRYEKGSSWLLIGLSTIEPSLEESALWTLSRMEENAYERGTEPTFVDLHPILSAWTWIRKKGATTRKHQRRAGGS